MKICFVILALLFNIYVNAQHACVVKIDTDDIMNAGRFKIISVQSPDRNVAENINHALAPENYTGFTKEMLRKSKGHLKNSEGNSIFEIASHIYKNADCVLSLQMQVTEEAAEMSATDGKYPITFHYFNFDLNTGKKLSITDIIKKDKIPVLLQLLNMRLKATYTIAKEKHREEYELNDYSGYSFTEEDLSNFYFGKNGLCFWYDFHFMHDDLAIVPKDIINVSKEQLQTLVVAHKYGL